ncbi:MAG: phosphatidylserine decarboxylase family protein [Nitrospirota bacterium]
MTFFKIAPEGYPFIFGSFVITIITLACSILNWKFGSNNFISYCLLLTAYCFFGITLFMAFFFRDPERKIPEGEGVFVSPADGKVILIKDIYEKDYLKADTREISIFMSPLDVHVNRVPCDGIVRVVKYSPGRFIAAYKDDASIKNENIVMVIDGKEGRVLVRQVAGFIARRAVCRVKVGDVIRRGERYGIIKFGSRLDVYLPKDTMIKVQLGDKVKAGETILAGYSKQ